MVTIDESRCVGCGLCAEDCLYNSITLTEGKARFQGDCLHCGHCASICPAEAISIPGYDMTDTEPCTGARLDPAALLYAIKSRRSIRSYRPEPVREEDLAMLIQAGRYTATAKNNQGCRFVFVQEALATLKSYVWDFFEDLDRQGDTSPNWAPFLDFNRRRKADPADDYLFRNAPMVLFVTSDWPLDAGLAAQNMETMAAALGMGALFNGYLARAADANTALKAWLGVADTKIRACLLLGYTDRTYQRTASRLPAKVIRK